MRKVILILSIFIVSIPVFSQGFDWQYSARLPFAHPKLFIGGNISIGEITTSGSFAFLEDFIPCCDYEAGSGNFVDAGLQTEFWKTGNLALLGGLGISYNTSAFSTTIEVPRSDGTDDYISKYQYKMDESRLYLNIDFGAKYRLLETHFSLGSKFHINYKLSSNANHTEKIVSPSTETFIDGSTERAITNGIVGKYNNFLLIPEVFVNYDFSIGLGYYSSLKLFSTLPMMSIVQNEKWNEWKFGFSVQVLKNK